MSSFWFELEWKLEKDYWNLNVFLNQIMEMNLGLLNLINDDFRWNQMSTKSDFFWTHCVDVKL